VIMTAAVTIKKVFLILYLIVIHLVIIYLIGEKTLSKYIYTTETSVAPVPLPPEAVPMPPESDPPADGNYNAVSPVTERQTPILTPSPASTSPMSRFIVPVAGVNREQLVDSFTAARSKNRVHDAIDIMAPAGTPVIAAADGEIIKFFDSKAGGITIYQLSTDKSIVYYYAHLQRRADDIRVGDMVKQGRTIGYVGDTGNAGPGNYHLHFSIASVTDPKRYWEGVYINPFPLLRN